VLAAAPRARARNKTRSPDSSQPRRASSRRPPSNRRHPQPPGRRAPTGGTYWRGLAAYLKDATAMTESSLESFIRLAALQPAPHACTEQPPGRRAPPPSQRRRLFAPPPPSSLRVFPHPILCTSAAPPPAPPASQRRAALALACCGVRRRCGAGGPSRLHTPAELRRAARGAGLLLGRCVAPPARARPLALQVGLQVSPPAALRLTRAGAARPAPPERARGTGGVTNGLADPVGVGRGGPAGCPSRHCCCLNSKPTAATRRPLRQRSTYPPPRRPPLLNGRHATLEL